jgi:hypothetical protein
MTESVSTGKTLDVKWKRAPIEGDDFLPFVESLEKSVVGWFWGARTSCQILGSP